MKVNGNEECEDTNPPLVFETLFEGDAVYVRGHDVVCIIGSRKFRPGFCMDVYCIIMRSVIRGGTGVGPPLVCLTVHCGHGQRIDE